MVQVPPTPVPSTYTAPRAWQEGAQSGDTPHPFTTPATAALSGEPTEPQGGGLPGVGGFPKTPIQRLIMGASGGLSSASVSAMKLPGSEE